MSGPHENALPATPVSRLRGALRVQLPGPRGQLRMTPRALEAHTFPAREPGPDARAAAVLLPLCEDVGGLCVLFIRRPDYDGPHGGQIAFPGGRREEGDADLAGTALRETQEELGIAPDAVELIGALTPLFVWVSNHLVHPYVGLVRGPLVLHPCPREVAQAFTVPLTRLLDPRYRGAELVRLKRGRAWVPYYALPGARLWGASAMMLAELVTLLEHRQDGSV